MDAEDLPLSREQLSIVAMALAVVTVSVAAPILFAPQSNAPEDANSGTVYTDTPQTSTPTDQSSSDPFNDLSATSSDPNPENLNPVPDSHVQSEGSAPPVSASSGAQTMRVETTTVDGEPALNLTDSRQHEGRWVSVSTAWLKDEFGTVPRVAGVIHEDGDVYSEELHIQNGQAVFWVRGFSTNIVTFGGTLEIDGQPATTGTTHLYEIRDLDSASDPEITLTGQVNTERDTKQVVGAANGDNISLAVAGDNLDPRNPEVTFTGIEQTTTDASLFSTTLSDGGTVNYTVDGNQPATNVSATFIGKSTATTRTISQSNLADGSTFSYTADGNIPANNVSVTFNGDTLTATDSESATGVSPTHSASIAVDGNLEPTDGTGGNPTLDVTAHNADISYDSISDLGDGSSDSSYGLMGQGNGDRYRSEAEIVPESGGSLQNVTINVASVSGQDYDESVDIYLVSGGVDGSITKETQIKSGWNPSLTTGQKTVSLDSHPTVSAGSTYHLEFVTTNSDGTSDYIYYDVGYDDSPSTTRLARSLGTLQSTDTFERVYDIQVGVSQPVTGLSASTDDGASTSLGDFSDGQTKSRTIDLSTSSTSLDFSAAQGGTIDYTLSWTEKTGAEDPSIDLDGDGSTDASYSGILASGQTATVSAPNIPNGSNTATASLTAGQVDADIDMTERTATKDPALDINDDGTTDASYNGVLLSGETVTKALPNISSGSQTAQVATQHKVGLEAGSTVTTTTEDPTLDIDGDGMAEAEYLGQLTEGETQTVQINEFDRTVDTARVGTQSGVVDVEIAYTERTMTEDAGVIVNGHPVRMTGTLSQDDTQTLSGNSSWLQSGVNNVTVVAGDGDVGLDAPDPTVEIHYTHELTTRRAVTYQDEAFSERYNISRTYLSSRENATLTIPHAENIIGLRALEVRVDQSGGWTAVPDSATTWQGTELTIDVASLTGGTVPNGTTVEIRSVGSKIDVHNGSVTVVRTTPAGYDLSSRVRLDTWNSDSYLGVRNTSQAHLLHYGANESYSGESDYTELSANHGQRVHFPDAGDGSKVGLKTSPVILSPENGTIRSSVPEAQTNETSPVFYVSPGQRVGEAFTVEYVGASEGSWYGVYEVDTTKRWDRVQGKETMTVGTDDIDSLLRIKTAPAPSSNPEGASSIFGAAQQGNLIPLTILFGGIAMLFVIGRNSGRSRDVVDTAASRAGATVERLPRGNLVAGAVESGVRGAGDLIITVGENQLLTMAIGAAALAAAIQSGLLQIGAEAGAIGTVAAIAVGSLLVLRQVDEFTTARWIGIVGVSGVVALQALGQGDLLTELVNSDAFIIVLLIVGYAVVQLVREYRANNSPDDDRPQINIISGGGGSDD